MTNIFPSLKKTIVLSGVLFFVAACSQKTAPTAVQPMENYDGPKVTYSENIAPIMERSCAPCHYPAKDGRKEALDTYTTVKEEAEDVLYRVQLPSNNFRHMPYQNKKPSFTAEEIEMFKNWVRGGFLES